MELTTLDLPFDDFSVGDTIRSRGRIVTETDIVSYASLSGDWTALHTDAEAAAAGPFGARIAHGGLTLSISTGLEFSLLGDARNVLAFYGMDRVRFVKPVFIGDTLHLRAEVVTLEPKDDARGIVTVRQAVSLACSPASVSRSSKHGAQGRPRLCAASRIARPCCPFAHSASRARSSRQLAVRDSPVANRGSSAHDGSPMISTSARHCVSPKATRTTAPSRHGT